MTFTLCHGTQITARKRNFASVLSDFIQNPMGCSHRHFTVFLNFSKLDPTAYRLLSISRDGLAVKISIIWSPTVHTVHVTTRTPCPAARWD